MTLKQIDKLIEKAKIYLNYPNNWDGEGGKQYSIATLITVRQFLISFGKYSPVFPQINPGPNGSFDIVFTDKEFELLVNVPKRLPFIESTMKPISFYGESVDGKYSIKGTIAENFHYKE
jgi:hypothetical protein